jgi:pyruvyltransferase
MILLSSFSLAGIYEADLPLYYWRAKKFENFGDYLSVEIVQRMIDRPVAIASIADKPRTHKLLALGSILYFAREGDTLWGTGMNAKYTKREDFFFTSLDVRAVRGPMTRHFLIDHFGIEVPEVYGDPALLIPTLFPEFQRKEEPKHKYVVIPHYSDAWMFPEQDCVDIIYPYEPWDVVIEKILDSEFVISSSLHGIIVAEAFGIPARWLRVSEKEPTFKFYDYYLGTGRDQPCFATTVEEALRMGGEVPAQCDLDKLMQSFPYDKFPSNF